MKTPRNNSIYFKCALWLYSFYHRGWLNKLVVGLFVIVPPSLISTLYSNKDLKGFIAHISPEFFSYIQGVGRDKVLLFNAVSFLWPVITVAIGAEIAKKANSDAVNVENLLALIKGLDSIVGSKNKRFGAFVNRLGSHSKETVFESITDPMLQISTIVQEIGIYFNATSEKKSTLIRVTFAIMQDGLIAQLPIYYPNDEEIKTTKEILNSANSAFIQAHQSKKLLLIPDIQKELKKSKDNRKFAETENEEDNHGSLICYPVRVYDNTYPFVISIHSDEPNHFKEDLIDVYKPILDRFALRLSVENSLLKIKESLCGK